MARRVVPRDRLFLTSLADRARDPVELETSLRPILGWDRTTGRLLDLFDPAARRLRTHDTPLLDLRAIVDTGSIAGNAGGLGGLVAQLGDETVPIWEIWAIIYSYLADSTVATRTTAATSPTMSAPFGTTDVYVAGFGTNGMYVPSAQLTLTASQEGAIYLVPGGQEVFNDNGTITFATGALELPLVGRDTALSVEIAAATNGQVADLHRAVVVGRQLA